MADTTAVAPTGLPGATAPTAVTNTPTLGKDDFLKLLMTQLTHQNPLDPMDMNQLLSQTAQLTQVEQLQNLNQSLLYLAAATTASGVTQASMLIGKTGKVTGSNVAFDGRSPVQLPYTLVGAGAPVQVQVLDSSGNVLRTLNANPRTPGEYAATWDGKDANGKPVSAGTYYYRVAAASGGDGTTAAYAKTGTITGFEVLGGQLYYQIGGSLVRPEDVISVQQ